MFFRRFAQLERSNMNYVCQLLFEAATEGTPFNRRIYSKMSAMERVVSNNAAAEQQLESIKEELKAYKNEKASRRVEELKAENDILRQQVEAARQKLIELETKNGKLQIPIPEQISIDITPLVKIEPKQENSSSAAQRENDGKPPKEKKPKKEKPTGDSKPAGNTASEEPPVDVGRLDMRVGKIVDVSRHPDADSLYVEKIDCGEAAPRTVISGLVKFVPIEQMQNRLVVVLCNLKPAKMRGILSEAMVMCASSPEMVEILSPPEGSVPGDLVHVEGYTRMPDTVLNPKKKIFETVAPDLHTNEQLVACYKQGAFMVPNKGVVKAQTLKNVNVK
ncbi:aminoacyl tRNA synthase complex-interacting multifunctional protein 1-like [Topomyia yanbarensis]|uniref:aminoacyl tRNA synthase complex-interacting multifunctional protein 1-like n=1 Tax=Topomyia yanbarensis TaxID=2498891 RepID=UPI00273B8221|nr:aminoacyl tRNA synthase complex-interacting multifunctional protein 1-like [Topomyia yanbarensis]XP_058840647.1 aminoacyl tRNA synthase complex-interacting multifunctional protein 1-like [Topomyia yanbarensis]